MSIEATEDNDRDWRHAYHTRIRDHTKRLKNERKAGMNRLSDKAIEREAYAKAEKEVQTALNEEAEAKRRSGLPRHETELDPDRPDEDITELPPIMSKADLFDSGIVEDIEEM